MAVERQPLTVLDRKEAGYQAQLSAFGTLKGSVASFQSAMHGLSSLSQFQAIKASSGDATVYTASAASTAVAGKYAITVTQLAASQKLTSAAFTNVTDSVGTGTLTFQFGSISGGLFTANSAKPAQTVTIGSANNTLSGVRDAINAAKIGVSASILNDGTGNKLVITSNDTGLANSLKISVSDTSDVSNTDNSGLSQLAYDPEVAGVPPQAGKNLTETVAAKNATLTVDGIAGISKASNTVTDVVQGVTLNLLKESTAPATLTVATDTAGVQTSVQNFVSAYNDLNKVISDLTAYDSKTKTAAVLQGDSSTLSVITQIRRVLNDTLTGLKGNYTQLSQVGITFQKDGSLALDSAKLQGAIDTNYTDIPGLFANVGKPSDSLVNFSSATSDTVAGSYALNITQLATQSVLQGAAITLPVTIDANNNTLGVKIDGVQSGTITLASGNYTTTAALIAEIQSKINGDSALKAAGVTASVSFDAGSGQLSITSDRYGSASSVQVTSIGTSTLATLGLSVASGTTAVDVAGTLNGISATGSGRFLTGAGGSVQGLKLEVVGGATGARGTVNYSLGYAYRLDVLSDQLLGASGPLASRTTGINSSITDINNRRDVLNRRLVGIEQRYRNQFSALDTLMSQLRSTSDFLTQQLAKLP
jgi:flagellar hook-associated protein 2